MPPSVVVAQCGVLHVVSVDVQGGWSVARLGGTCGVLSGVSGTTPRVGPLAGGQPPGIAQGPPQQPLDVGVEAAQVVRGPAGERGVDWRVEAEQGRLALRPGSCDPGAPLSGRSGLRRSLVERAGVDDRGGRWSPQRTTSRLLTIAALRSSSSSTMPCSIEPGEGHLDHADRALDDPGARGDDGVGLLPAQHGLGDLRGVGEMADPHLDDLDAGDRTRCGDLLGELGGDEVGRPRSECPSPSGSS